MHIKVIPQRILRPSDINRLRGDAKPRTHLARYELANNRHAHRVLDEPCPESDCGAAPGSQCFSGS
jgi:hypothetical protein